MSYDCLSNEMNYSILSKAEVLQRLEDKITKVCNVLDKLPRSEAAILLHHFKWGVSRTKDEWFTCEEKVRRAVGLFARPVAETPSDAVAIACSVCQADFPRNVVFSVSCGHQICRSCWECYIRQAIDEGPRCLTLRCPKPLCDAAVDFDLIKRLSSEDDKDKFENHLLRTYIAHRSKLKWCPAPDCNYVAFSSNGGKGNVTCPSSHSFCWSCSGEGHAPVDCNTFAEWKSESDRQTQNWVLANTISCPSCTFQFEKEASSDFYTECSLCNSEFCSGCGDNWYSPEGNFHLCTRNADNDPNTAKELAKKSLNRYNCHYVLWAKCESSRANALTDLSTFQNLQREPLCSIFNLSVKDFDFLVEALQQVAECWQVLKWMHVYGYFLATDELVKKHFFKFMQDQAEDLVKRLQQLCVAEDLVEEAEKALCSEVTEVSYAKFVEYQTKIIIRTRLTRNYIDKWVEGLMTGLSDVVCMSEDSELSQSLNLLRVREETSCNRKSPNSSLS